MTLAEVEIKPASELSVLDSERETEREKGKKAFLSEKHLVLCMG